jgi:hypothetical protein
MKQEIKKKLIKQGQDILLPWIDVTGNQYVAKIETTAEMENCLVMITFTHKNSHKTVRISMVYYNENTGEILQYGSNYGELVL